jgi:hypothetical protein
MAWNECGPARLESRDIRKPWDLGPFEDSTMTRRLLITAVVATLALSPVAWAQSSGGGSAGGGAAGTGGNAASTAGTSNAAISGQSLGAGNVPSQPGLAPGQSNPAGVNGGLGNTGIPQQQTGQQSTGVPPQTPGVNSAGTANGSGGAAAGGSRGTTVGRSNNNITGPNNPGSADVTDPLQKEVDKKMNGVCRGC